MELIGSFGLVEATCGSDVGVIAKLLVFRFPSQLKANVITSVQMPSQMNNCSSEVQNFLSQI